MVKKLLCVASVLLLAAVGGLDADAKQRKIPLPRLKPADLHQSELPPATIEPVPFPPMAGNRGWATDTVLAERQDCAQRLKGLPIIYEPMAPIGQAGGCGAAAALKVSQIAGVTIVPSAELTCDMVEALHGWLSSSVLPAARLELKKKVVKINNASAYVCRRRNGLASGKLSEHAKANALDIATLGFDDGSSISIKGDWSGLKQLIGMSAQGNFLRVIRRDACIRFTTVLGPGSDPYHGDHFHIDVARRKNGYRICK
jgi:hypothetical protein